jgi:hypothetical protein
MRSAPLTGLEGNPYTRSPICHMTHSLARHPRGAYYPTLMSCRMPWRTLLSDHHQNKDQLGTTR